ncbi:unnamed protein product, partial [Allacma fusca]
GLIHLERYQGVSGGMTWIRHSLMHNKNLPDFLAQVANDPKRTVSSKLLFFPAKLQLLTYSRIPNGAFTFRKPLPVLFRDRLREAGSPYEVVEEDSRRPESAQAYNPKNTG